MTDLLIGDIPSEFLEKFKDSLEEFILIQLKLDNLIAKSPSEDERSKKTIEEIKALNVTIHVKTFAIGEIAKVLGISEKDLNDLKKDIKKKVQLEQKTKVK